MDYSWMVGLIVSGVVYFALSRSLDLAGEQTAIEASDRQLQAIDAMARAAAARPDLPAHPA